MPQQIKSKFLIMEYLNKLILPRKWQRCASNFIDWCVVTCSVCLGATKMPSWGATAVTLNYFAGAASRKRTPVSATRPVRSPVDNWIFFFSFTYSTPKKKNCNRIYTLWFLPGREFQLRFHKYSNQLPVGARRGFPTNFLRSPPHRFFFCVHSGKSATEWRTGSLHPLRRKWGAKTHIVA